MDRKIKILSVLGLAICIILISIYFINARASLHLYIVYTSDILGFITPHELEHRWVPSYIKNPYAGGAAYWATYLKKQRSIAAKKHYKFLLLDTGNFFFGTPEGCFFKGESVIEVMNMLNYDAMVVGDKDFAYGEENLRGLVKKACFPFLSANIVQKDTGKLLDFVKPYIVKKIKKLKIGIIGVTTDLANQRIYPEHIKNLDFLPPIPSLKKYIDILKEERVDAVIVLSNLGMEGDKVLAQKVQGIDVIIGGNNEKGGYRPPAREPPYNTIIAASDPKGLGAFPLLLRFNIKTGKLVQYWNPFEDIWIEKFKPDLTVEKKIKGFREAIDAKLKERIGYVEGDLFRSHDKESILGDWIADILREKTKTDLCLVGGLQADIRKGDITIGDIYNVLPIVHRLEVMDFNLAILELSGEKIKYILEYSVGWALENSKYGILQVSGLKMIYDPKGQKGNRVGDVTIAGKRLDPNKIYKVAVNGYLASGGDKYYDIITADKRYDTGLMDFDVLVEYLKDHSPITAPSLEGRIVRIEEK